MSERDSTRAQVERALRVYHTSYRAAPARRGPSTTMIYVATVDGRELKVYVEDGKVPVLVKTMAWKD